MTNMTEVEAIDMLYEPTESDVRLALYWEHYEAGGRFDGLDQATLTSLEKQMEITRRWLETHHMPTQFRGICP